MKIIGGIYKGRKIKTASALKAPLLRPTTGRVKESVFAILTPYIAETNILDLFSGSGNIGIEAISRGAKKITFVENNKTLCKLIKKNIDLLGIKKENYKILCMDYIKALKLLEKQNERFDFIYADPPYERKYYTTIINTIRKTNLLDTDGLLILEEPKKNPFIQENNKWIVERRHYGTTTVTFMNFAER